MNNAEFLARLIGALLLLTAPGATAALGIYTGAITLLAGVALITTAHTWRVDDVNY